MTSLMDFDALGERGWLEIPSYFEDSAVAALMDWALTLAAKDRMRPAAIRSNKTVNQNIRGDSIYWIEDWDANEIIGKFKTEFKELGQTLAKELRVPLKSFEGHLSRYGVGDFYRKHLDQLPGQRRQITAVCYLNECSGGELAIYRRGERRALDRLVKPAPGKLVLFLSPFIFHEVLPGKSPRYGLTGWFRDDGDVFSPGIVLYPGTTP